MTRRTLLILIAAVVSIIIIVIGVGIFILLPVFTANHTSTKVTATQTVTTTKKINPMHEALQKYGPDIRNQLAQGLHLPLEQVKTQLKAGKTLAAIATAQGLNTTQLQTLVHDSLTNGLKPAISTGDITQKQLDRQIENYQIHQINLEHFLAAKA